MADPVQRVVSALPPRAESVVSNPATRALYGAYIDVHNRAHGWMHTRAIDGVNAEFHTPTRSAWGSLNWQFRHERPVIEHLADSIREGDYETYYDVGANVGCFVCLLGALVDRTIAFEPYPPNATLLERNVCLNDVDAEVHRIALSDENGETSFQVPTEERPGSDQLTIMDSHPNSAEFARREHVQTRTLDSYVEDADLPAPDLIKIDVEGAGLRALHGMETQVARHRPTLCVEPHGNAESVTELLRDWEYDLATVAPDRNDGEHPTIVARS